MWPQDIEPGIFNWNSTKTVLDCVALPLSVPHTANMHHYLFLISGRFQGLVLKYIVTPSLQIMYKPSFTTLLTFEACRAEKVFLKITAIFH
jgi:hypothetical protein